MPIVVADLDFKGLGRGRSLGKLGGGQAWADLAIFKGRVQEQMGRLCFRSINQKSPNQVRTSFAPLLSTTLPPIFCPAPAKLFGGQAVFGTRAVAGVSAPGLAVDTWGEWSGRRNPFAATTAAEPDTPTGQLEQGKNGSGDLLTLGQPDIVGIMAAAGGGGCREEKGRCLLVQRGKEEGVDTQFRDLEKSLAAAPAVRSKRDASLGHCSLSGET